MQSPLLGQPDPTVTVRIRVNTSKGVVRVAVWVMFGLRVTVLKVTVRMLEMCCSGVVRVAPGAQ